jgi:disulfide bond formation protein DsbB
LLDARRAPVLACIALAAVAASGFIGAYQAGMEWGWLQGPAFCSGHAVAFHGLSDLNNEHIVPCDVAQWRLFGLSLAGYNAIFSLGVAGLGAFLLARKTS